MVNKRNCALGLVLAILLLIVIAVIANLGSNSYSSYNSYDTDSYTSGYDFSSFNVNDCKDISFKELNKNPDKYYGDSIKLSGKVMQITEGRSTNYLLMYVGGDYSQLAYIEYYNDTNIVEDDWITVYGVCAGSYTYETKIGGSNTVPSMYGASLVKN